MVQQTLQTFQALRGAITYDQGKARYCLDLNGLSPVESRAMIDTVESTITLVLQQLRNDR